MVDTDHGAPRQGSMPVWEQFPVGSRFPTQRVADRLRFESENNESWLVREEASGRGSYL
jgi:hypothetical protein